MLEEKECITCIDNQLEFLKEECINSKRECKHHCNHSWSHDFCCWCEKEFIEN